MENNTSTTVRIYTFRIKHRANDVGGAVDYTVTETLTFAPNGAIRVDVHSVGWAEGSRVDQRDTRHYPADERTATQRIESAHAYRTSNGYMVVQ